jgi:hypothetical protein
MHNMRFLRLSSVIGRSWHTAACGAPSRTRRLGAGVLGAVLLGGTLLGGGGPAHAVVAPVGQEKSSSAWSQAARAAGVDLLSLYAIALKETQRVCVDGAVRPWPWTLNTPELGQLYFESYEAASRKLTALIAQGVTNIDIGVMQINWKFNGYRLPDPVRLLIPRNNIAVAGQILAELRVKNGGDLTRAVALYHSPHDERGMPYAQSVRRITESLREVRGLAQALASEPL